MRVFTVSQLVCVCVCGGGGGGGGVTQNIVSSWENHSF